MDDPSQSTEVMIDWEVHALSEAISELTRYAVSHRDLLKRDVRELHIHYNRLALVISALEAEPKPCVSTPQSYSSKLLHFCWPTQNWPRTINSVPT